MIQILQVIFSGRIQEILLRCIAEPKLFAVYSGRLYGRIASSLSRSRTAGSSVQKYCNRKVPATRIELEKYLLNPEKFKGASWFPDIKPRNRPWSSCFVYSASAKSNVDSIVALCDINDNDFVGFRRENLFLLEVPKFSIQESLISSAKEATSLASMNRLKRFSFFVFVDPPTTVEISIFRGLNYNAQIIALFTDDYTGVLDSNFQNVCDTIITSSSIEHGFESVKKLMSYNGSENAVSSLEESIRSGVVRDVDMFLPIYNGWEFNQKMDEYLLSPNQIIINIETLDLSGVGPTFQELVSSVSTGITWILARESVARMYSSLISDAVATGCWEPFLSRCLSDGVRVSVEN